MEEIFEKFKKEEDIFNKARIVKFLIKEKGLQIKQIAQNLNVSSSYICHLERLLNLPEIIIDGYYSKMINISQLFLLSRINDQDNLIKIYEKILSDNLTFQQTEELIREELYKIKNKGQYLDINEKNNLINKFNNKYKNSNLKIIQSKVKGKINIEIKDNLEKSSKLIKKLINAMIEAKD